MKKTIGIFALLIGLFFTSVAQETLFQRTIGGSKSENSYGIQRTLDGGYISVGYTESYGKGKKDIFLVKSNGMGEVQWSKTYGESGDDIGWNLATTSDSGFVITGSTDSYNKDGDAIVIKTDKNGKVEWSRTMASDSVEDGYNVIQSFYSKGYYVTGYVKNDSLGDQCFLAKLGSSGNVRWYKAFGSPGDDEAYGLTEDGRGNVVVTGQTTYDSVVNGGLTGSAGTSDAFIAKFDSTGNLKWMNAIGSEKDDAGWDVKVTNNTYIVTGWTKAVSVGDNDLLVMTCDTSGGSIAPVAIGTNGNDRGFDVVIRPSNAGYAVVGYAEPQPGDRQVFFAEFDNTHKLGNTNIIGGSDRDGHWPTDIVTTPDGGYMILSTSRSFNSNTDDDFYLVKLRANGSTLCNSSVQPFNSFNLNFKSTAFGSTVNGVRNQTPTVSTTTVSSVNDSTLCCQLSAELTRDSVEVCKGLSVSIGKLSITGVKYSWTDDTGKEISTKANPSVSPSSTTTYKLVVSSADQACSSDSTTIKVIVNDFLTEDLARDTSFCDGDSVNIVGSANLISYLWVGNTVNSSNRTIKLKQADTIVFSGIDGNSCQYKDTMIATVNANPTFSLGNDTTICEVSSIELTGPANMSSYNWNSGEGSNQTFTTSAEKTHKLDVVDANGCIASDEILILTNPSSPFSLGADDTFCTGASFTILGPGALSGYIWNDTASNLQNIVVSKAGSYHLTAFNSFNCPSSDTIVLVERDQPMFSLGNDFALCVGSSRYLVGPKDLTSYKWNNNSSDDSLLINNSGTYWLRVTDEFTCTYTDSITVNTATKPIISLGNDTTITKGDSVLLTPGAGFASYNWSTSETTPSIYAKDAGTYSVTVTNADGCEGTASMKLDTKLSIENLRLLGLNYFPNPANDKVTIQFGSMSNDDLTIQLSDLTGKVLQTRSFTVYPGENSFTIDLKGLSAGNYYLGLSNSQGSSALKIVVE